MLLSPMCPKTSTFVAGNASLRHKFIFIWHEFHSGVRWRKNVPIFRTFQRWQPWSSTRFREGNPVYSYCTRWELSFDISFILVFNDIRVYLKFQTEVGISFLVCPSLHRQPYENLLVYLSVVICNRLYPGVRWHKVFLQ